MRYISDLKIDENVIEHYLCKKKQTLKSRAGKNYLSLLLQDKTGTINAKVWGTLIIISKVLKKMIL